MPDRCRRLRINGLCENDDIIIVVIVRWPSGKTTVQLNGVDSRQHNIHKNQRRSNRIEKTNKEEEVRQTLCTQGDNRAHCKCLDVFLRRAKKLN